MRLYPIPFRDLPKVQRFSKYQFIDVKAWRPTDDRRPESWRVDADAITLGPRLDTTRGWAQRRPYVEPLLTDSMCALRRRQEIDGTSLGAFRPADVAEVTARPAEDWAATKKAAAAQLSLLAPADRLSLEPLPWEFRYRYRCADRSCNGHHQKIINWELGEAWRTWDADSESQRVEMIRDKWLDKLAGPAQDTVFFVGNMHRWPRDFLILGVYYPLAAATSQQTLPI